MVRVARMALMWLLSVTWWTVLAVAQALTLRNLPDRWVLAAVHAWARSCLAVLGIRLELSEPNPWLEPAARVVVCNHQSAIDVLWGAAVCPSRPLLVGKKEVLFVPVLNLIFWTMAFVRVDRDNHENAMANLRGVAELVRRDGRSLVVAPEGTRSRDGAIGPFKKGAFHMAIAAQAPVCPMVVDGAFDAWPRGAWLVRPGTVRLRFLPPVPTAGLAASDVGSLMDRVRGEMIRALQEPRGGAAIASAASTASGHSPPATCSPSAR
jgi:1-acyl-sn-glycerol-3-phosphate acyltransferase